ncbi:hypothetical protein ScPMuIL_010327 [Solemya velum]
MRKKGPWFLEGYTMASWTADHILGVLQQADAGHVLRRHQVSEAIRAYKFMKSELDNFRATSQAKDTPSSTSGDGSVRTELVQFGRPNRHQRPRSEGVRSYNSNSSDDQMMLIRRRDRERMENTISQHENKIDELNSRLSMMSIGKSLDGPTDFTDFGETLRPEMLADDFFRIYRNEWKEAHDSLVPLAREEAHVIYYLMKIIRTAYFFCTDVAREQLNNLVKSMEIPMLRPTMPASLGKFDLSTPSTPDSSSNTTLAVGLRYAKQYRKATAESSVRGLTELFNRNKLPEIFDMRLLSEPVKRYSDRCVETIWRLCVQDPPLSLHWQESGKLVKTEHFNFYNQQGGYVKEAVWPAVFLCEDGPLLSKGYVLASK